MRPSKPTFEELNKIDLSHLSEAIKETYSAQFINLEPGKEHYKLLAWISTLYKKGKIVEIGTYEGAGALALSYGGRPVTTYDIQDVCHDYVKSVVEFKNDFVSTDDFKGVKVVFIDISHNGKDEMLILKGLIETGFRGIVIFDDIHLNPEMKQFWAEVKKLGIDSEDWTDVGHWSGTGVIFL